MNDDSLSFDLTLDLSPKKEIGKAHSRKLLKSFRQLDFWAFAEGLTYDHALERATSHLAFTTQDDILIGIYSNGNVTLRAEDFTISRIPRIEQLTSGILSKIDKALGRRNAYKTQWMLHCNDPSRKLIQFMHASSKSALGPYLRANLGDKIVVRGLLVQLEKGLLIGMILPDDMDFLGRFEMPRSRKGFLRPVVTRSIKARKRLVGIKNA